jgi:hypothetical protein
MVGKKKCYKNSERKNYCFLRNNIFFPSEFLANKLLKEEWKILKTMLRANKMQQNDFQHFLSHRFMFLRDGIEDLFYMYKKYVGKGVYLVVRAWVCINAIFNDN